MTYRPEDWKPGDVAMVTYEGVRSSVAIRGTSGGLSVWRFADAAWVSDDGITDARPLVVLDPESGDDALRLAQAINPGDCAPGGANQQRARYALRALVTPPKPDEPQGLGAVVGDREGVRWVRADTDVNPWIHPSAGWRWWSDFDHTVRVLSEGVQ